MNRYIFATVLSIFGLLFTFEASAVTCTGIGPKPVVAQNPDWMNTPNEPEYGVFIISKAYTYSGCDSESTPRNWYSADPYYPYNRDWTGELSYAATTESYYTDSAGNISHAISSADANANAAGYFHLSMSKQYAGANTGSEAFITDILRFEKPGAAAGEITEIPYTVCGFYDSYFLDSWAVSNLGAYLTHRFSRQRTLWSKAIDPTDDGIAIDGASYVYFGNTHSFPGQTHRCIMGNLKLGGSRAVYSAVVSGWVAGSPGPDFNTQGTLDAIVTLTLPEGVSCTSSSGKFPGCQ